MVRFMASCSTKWQNILKKELPGDYKTIRWELHQDYDCDFNHNINNIKKLCSLEDELIEDKLNMRFSNKSNPRMMSHEEFHNLLMLEDSTNVEDDGYPALINDPLNVFSTNSIQGLLVVEGGVLKEDSRHPGMGACIQRTNILDAISQYTKDLMREHKLDLPKSCVKICGAHSYQVNEGYNNSNNNL